MSGLILPNRFTSQPPASTLVDQAKAKELGVVYLAVANESGMLRDVIGGKDIVNPGGSSTGHTGRVWTFSGAQQSNKAITLIREDSLFVCARIKATAAQAGVPGAAFGVYNSGAQSGFGVGFSGSNQVGLAWLTNAGAGISAYSTGALNAWYDVYTNLETASVGKRAWINGRPATTTQGSSVTSWITGQNEIAVGAQHRSSGFLRNFTGHIEWAAVLILDNAKIDDALSARLYADRFPYNLFKSQSRRIWVASTGTDTPVNPGVGTIAITGYAPSIAQTANQAITPNVGNIVITGYAPTISQPQAVNPGVGSLTITGYAPTVTQNVDVPVNPGVGTIAITGYAPTVAQTANQSVLPATGTIAITGYSPTVSQSANQAVTPDVGTITITGYAPIVQQAPASQNITPDVGTITITGYAPTVEQSSPLRLGGFEYGSKVYIKRNKKIYIFDSVEEADSYIEAESKVEEIVQQSNKTSRLARKRAREKAHKLLSIEPVESVDIPALKTLVSQLQTDFELPQWIARQDWQRVVEIYNQAMEMQDEEDLLLIL